MLAEFKSLVYVDNSLRSNRSDLISRFVKLGFDACSQRHLVNPLYAMLVKRIKEQLPLNPHREHALSKKLTKRISTNYLFDPPVGGEFVVLLEQLNFVFSWISGSHTWIY